MFTSILFLIYGCSKKVEISPDSNEVNCLYYFIARTEQGGDSEIDVFQRFDFHHDEAKTDKNIKEAGKEHRQRMHIF